MLCSEAYSRWGLLDNHQRRTVYLRNYEYLYCILFIEDFIGLYDDTLKNETLMFDV